MRPLCNWLVSPLAALIVISAMSAAPTAARAQTDAAAPASSSHLAAAQRLYQKLDLDAALAELKEAETEARDHNDENMIVTVLIYKGLINADNGKEQDMTEYFKRALAIRPWVDVPPNTSPRLAKLFNDERKELWGSGGQLKPPPKKKPHPPGATMPPSSSGPSGSATSAPMSPQPGAPAQAAPAGDLAPSAASSTPPPAASTPAPAPTPAAPAAPAPAPATPAPAPHDDLEPPH